jgi:drug/metabolite transporter (DMT)-like permease
MGFLGVIGHVLMATAFAKAEAARLAPLEYTALVWAALFGYVAFAEVPTMATLGGGALIVGAALLANRR